MMALFYNLNMLFYKGLTPINSLIYKLSTMKNNNYDLVLIRHAQSRFNEATSIEANNLGLRHLSWD